MLRNYKNLQIVWSEAVQKYVSLVELEKCCKMSIYLQKSVSIEPRTSPDKYHMIGAREPWDRFCPSEVAETLPALDRVKCGLFFRVVHWG